jgi:hypothetical protein
MSPNWRDILERQRVRTNFCLESLKGRGDLEELDLDGILPHISYVIVRL